MCLQDWPCWVQAPKGPAAGCPEEGGVQNPKPLTALPSDAMTAEAQHPAVLAGVCRVIGRGAA